MSGSVSAIVAVEVMSILVCSCVLYGNIFEVRIHSQKNKVFSFACFFTIISLICDILSWVLEGKQKYDFINYAVTGISLATVYLLIGIFVMYVSSYMRERKATPPKFFASFTIFCLICFVLTLLAPMFGLMFHLEDGFVVYTDLYYLYAAVAVILCLTGVGIVCYARPVIGLHNAVATGLYIAIPCDAAILNYFYPNIGYSYPAITLSVVILYVMIQSESVNSLEREKQISSYYAHHDELTGLLSRRAFNERMDELKTRKSDIAVIFIDMNGLKITNDTKGHLAGDEMLISFGKTIESVFRKEDIFRIGGDEFVVIIENIEKETFKERLKEFEDKIVTERIPLACYGTKFGKSCDIEELIRVAEAGMYKEKVGIHEKFPELNR